SNPCAAGTRSSTGHGRSRRPATTSPRICASRDGRCPKRGRASGGCRWAVCRRRSKTPVSNAPWPCATSARACASASGSPTPSTAFSRSRRGSGPSTSVEVDAAETGRLEFGEFEGHGHGLNLLGPGEGATEQLLDLGHPGPHGVTMDAEFGGDPLTGSPGAYDRLQSRPQRLSAPGPDQLAEEAVDEALGHRGIAR